MRRLLIVGAGGFGREVASWCKQHPDHGRVWEFGGYLDDTLFGNARAVVSSITGYEPRSDDVLICAIGQPRGKRSVCTALLSKGAEFLTFVHPLAVIGTNVTLGRGSFLCPGAIITCDVDIGEFVMLNLHATIGHDAKVGAFATLSSHCDVTGGCAIGEGAFLGSGSRIIPGKSVGAWATVGAGAVVISAVKPGVTVFGNPARVLAT